MPSDMRAIAPTMPASRVMSLVSKLRTCDISCATTPCSSSRLSVRSKPSVTAMLALRGSMPVANALGSESGTTQTRGSRQPGRDGHFLHHVHQSPLVIIRRLDHLPGAGGPKHAIRLRFFQEYQQTLAAISVATMPMNGNDVVIGAGGRVAGFEIETRISPEADPGEEDDEAGDQPERSPAITGLLLEEIGGGHSMAEWRNGGMAE